MRGGDYIFWVTLCFYGPACSWYPPLHETSGDSQDDREKPLCFTEVTSCPKLPKLEEGVVVASDLDALSAEAIGINGGIFALLNRRAHDSGLWYRASAIEWKTGGDAHEYDLGFEEYAIIFFRLACANEVMGVTWIDGGNEEQLFSRQAFSTISHNGAPALNEIVEIGRDGSIPAIALLPDERFVVAYYNNPGINVAFGSLDGDVIQGPLQVFPEELSVLGTVSLAAANDGYVMGFAGPGGGYVARCREFSCSMKNIGDIRSPGVMCPVHVIATPFGPFATYNPSNEGLHLLDIEKDQAVRIDHDISNTYKLSWAGDRFLVFYDRVGPENTLVLVSFDKNGVVLEETIFTEERFHVPFTVVTTGEDLVAVWGRWSDPFFTFDLVASWAPCK